MFYLSLPLISLLLNCIRRVLRQGTVFLKSQRPRSRFQHGGRKHAAKIHHSLLLLLLLSRGH